MFYCYHYISIVASWVLFICSILATDSMLALSADDKWNLGSNGFVDSDDSISFDTIDDNDDEEKNLFAKNAVHGPCHAAVATDAMSDLFTTLETRDSSCSPNPKKSSSSPPAPLLFPESVQLFKDPNQVLNDLLLPSSSNSPSEHLEPLRYPGYLTPEQASDRTPEDRVWDLDAMGLKLRDYKFVCPSPLYKVPVVCDGPFDATSSLGGCDIGKMGIFFFFWT